MATISGTHASITRELAIIAADCADPHSRVGCDELTINAAARLMSSVADLAIIRRAYIKAV